MMLCVSIVACALAAHGFGGFVGVKDNNGKRVVEDACARGFCVDWLGVLCSLARLAALP
jgi:hypothetical protein